MIKIKRGMDIPLQGAPQQVIEDAPAARAVALVGFDYVGMKPTMAVKEGDRVKLGQLLFTDKKTEGVRYTARTLGLQRKTIQRWLRAEGIQVKRCPDWVYDWAYWRRKRREKWEHGNAGDTDAP